LNFLVLPRLAFISGRIALIFQNRFAFTSFFRNFAANMEYTLNCNGKLLALSAPQVMGILNATPDSFYAGSRTQTEQEIAERTHQIVSEGASIIDVGACSTRPDSEPATEQEEMERLRFALSIVRREAPDAIVSVDTFRPDVARMVVEEFGADIINDVGISPSSSRRSPSFIRKSSPAFRTGDPGSLQPHPACSWCKRERAGSRWQTGQ
jgi:dihydropteroate synthase